MGYYRFPLPIWNLNKLYVIASHNKVNKKAIFGKLDFLQKYTEQTIDRKTNINWYSLQ